MSRFSYVEKKLLDKIFVRSGYVLDFSDRTFAEFFDSEMGVNIDDPVYRTNGTSKGNRLRTFFGSVDDATVGRAITALWDYEQSLASRTTDSEEVSRMAALVARLTTPTPLAAPDGPAHLSTSSCSTTSGVLSALASYAHQGEVYDRRVLEIVQHLQQDGVDAISDHLVDFPPEGWPAWMDRELAERRFVLVFASERYKRCAEGKEDLGFGLGVIWEHGTIRRELYKAGRVNERFLPVGFGPDQRKFVPDILHDYTYFDLDSEADYQKLLRVMRGSPHPLSGRAAMSAPQTSAPSGDELATSYRAEDEFDVDHKTAKSTQRNVSDESRDDLEVEELASPNAGETVSNTPLKRSKRYIRKSSTVLFSERFTQAFPGVRGRERFEQPIASVRLAKLLERPLTFQSAHNEWFTPIWFWGRGDLGIERFSIQETGKVLLDVFELEIDEIVAFNSGIYYQQFVYVSSKASEPTGLYPLTSFDPLLELHGYAEEEYAVYNGHNITRAEYDDGAAVINSRVVDVRGSAKLRVRMVSPFNFLIAAQNSPINAQDFDSTLTKLLDGILRGSASLEDLSKAVYELPKRRSMSYEF